MVYFFVFLTCVSRQANVKLLEGLEEVRAILKSLKSSDLPVDTMAFRAVEECCDEITIYADSVLSKTTNTDANTITEPSETDSLYDASRGQAVGLSAAQPARHRRTSRWARLSLFKSSMSSSSSIKYVPSNSAIQGLYQLLIVLG